MTLMSVSVKESFSANVFKDRGLHVIAAYFVPILLSTALPDRTWALSKMLQKCSPSLACRQCNGILRRCSLVPNSTHISCRPSLKKAVMWRNSNTTVLVSLDKTIIRSHPLSTLQSMWDSNQLSASSSQVERKDTSVAHHNCSCLCALIISLLTTIPLKTTLSRFRRVIFRTRSWISVLYRLMKAYTWPSHTCAFQSCMNL